MKEKERVHYKTVSHVLCGLLVTLLLCCKTVFAEGIPAPTEKATEKASEATTTAVISVTDIEVSGYQKDIKMGGSIALSATVLPSNATNQQVTYQSSNASVATVSSSGEVKGISAGTAEIRLTAGGFTKSLALNVKVVATNIDLQSSYIVLKPGNTFSLQAAVYPSNATEQDLNYKSLDNAIASVSGGGVVTAIKNGCTTIIVSSTDVSVVATVVVNQNSISEAVKTGGEEDVESMPSRSYPDSVSVSAFSVIEPGMLRYFYESGKSLSIVGDGYTLKIDGKQIKNYDNALYTGITFVQTDKGTEFTLNHGENLCGIVSMTLDKDVISGRYLYLYNHKKGRYQLIKATDLQNLELASAGNYLVTSSKLDHTSVGKWLLIGGPVIIATLVVAYIIVKRKYWFW